MKKTVGEKIFDGFNLLIMVLLCIICLYPFLYVLFASFSQPSALAAHQGLLLAPTGFTFSGYKLVFRNPNISSGYLNTLFYLVVGTTVSVILTSVAAYIMSRSGWMWAKPLTMLVTFHMFFSGGLIPFFLLIKDLGWIDKRVALIIPAAMSVWNLIILRTAFRGISPSLEESARIDGANDLQILFRIVMPVSKAALAVQVLYYAVGIWNSWFAASIYLRDRAKYPLQLILREILISNDMQNMQTVANPVDVDNYSILIKYAVIIVATVPILVIYPLLQKYFVKGVMIGSIKE